MSVVAADARRRWGTAAFAVAALVATPVVVGAWPVAAADVAPAALRADVLASGDQPYVGLAESTGDATLPDLPQLDTLGDLLTGTTRMRVWYAAPDRWRVAVLQLTGEQDLVAQPGVTDLWDYGEQRLTRVIGALPVRLPWAADLTPPELARRVLSLGSEADRLEALPDQRVAGVAAAGFRVTPADPDTTIARVDVWADPASGLPVRVAVVGRGAERPSLASAFLELALTAPTEDVVQSSVPAGALLLSTTEPDIVAAVNGAVDLRLPTTLDGSARRPPPRELSGVGVYGTGWDSLVVLGLTGRGGFRVWETAREAATGSASVELDGGVGLRLASSLVSTLVVRVDGPGGSRRGGVTYVLAGLATSERLERAAADLLADRAGSSPGSTQ